MSKPLLHEVFSNIHQLLSRKNDAKLSFNFEEEDLVLGVDPGQGLVFLFVILGKGIEGSFILL